MHASHCPSDTRGCLQAAVQGHVLFSLSIFEPATVGSAPPRENLAHNCECRSDNLYAPAGALGQKFSPKIILPIRDQGLLSVLCSRAAPPPHLDIPLPSGIESLQAKFALATNSPKK